MQSNSANRNRRQFNRQRMCPRRDATLPVQRKRPPFSDRPRLTKPLPIAIEIRHAAWAEHRRIINAGQDGCRDVVQIQRSPNSFNRAPLSALAQAGSSLTARTASALHTDADQKINMAERHMHLYIGPILLVPTLHPFCKCAETTVDESRFNS